MVRTNKPLDPCRTGRDAQKLDCDLKSKLVGQDEAVTQIVNIYQTFLSGMTHPGRPVGNFLFLGPTGTGKTRAVEATAESLVGDPKAVTKVDCAEFQHSHEIAKLIGSPPGYLGHRETHPMLSQEALNQFHTDKVKLSFVLFDEIEKASDALWNLLLGILDKATLTLGDNRRVDFSRALIFMTSNLGACETESMLRPRFGFRGPVSDDVKLDSRLASTGVEAARRKFTPEFMNRIDKVVTFRTLGKEQLRQILDIELGMVQQRIFDSSKAPPFVFSLTDPAKQFLLTEGTDLRYGARHLKRAIERNLVQPLSNLLATEQIVSDDMIRVDLDCRLSCLTFTKVAEDVPSYAMAQLAGVQNPSAAARAASGLPVEVIRTANPRQSRRP